MPQTFKEPAVARFIPWSSRTSGAICAICDKRLDVHEAARGVTCGGPDCELQFLKKRLRLEHEKEQRILQAALDRRTRAAQALGEDLDEFPVAVLPSNDRPLTTLPDERKRSFEDRLRRCTDEAIALHGKEGQLGTEVESPADGEDLPHAAPEDPGLLTILGRSCAVCRGECCWQGRDHAFITTETILLYLKAHPAIEPAEVMEAYLSRLGNETYDNSCVFHGRAGCLLPREMRSETCNDYFCKGLSKFRLRLENSKELQGFAVAMADEKIVRSASLDPEKARYHDGASPAQTRENRVDSQRSV